MVDLAQASETKILSQKNYDFIQNFNQLNTDLGLDNPIDLSELTREGNQEKKMQQTEESTESTTEHSMENIVSNNNL